MEQAEHNVKIKTYKRWNQPSPLVQCVHSLNSSPIFPNNLEQEKLLDRFQQIHWQTEKISQLTTQEKVFAIKEEQNNLLGNQQRERNDVENHRLTHLQGIKDNIQESRERFFRRTQLERPGAMEAQLGPEPLYKIVNDGKPIKF